MHWRRTGLALVVSAALLSACTGDDAAPAATGGATAESITTSSAAPMPTESTPAPDHCVFDYGAQLAVYDTGLRTVRWTTDVPYSGFQRAWVDRSIVATKSYEGITALRLGDGSAAWSWSPPGGPSQPISSLSHQIGTMLVATPAGLTAIDSATGEVRWTVTDVDATRLQVTSPAPEATVTPSTPLYVNENGRITARDPQDGSVVWTYDTPGDWSFAPLLTDREVLHTRFEGSVYSLDPATGSENWAWSARPGVAVGMAFVAADDVIVAPTTPYLQNPQGVTPPTDATQLVGLDRTTGAVRWALPLPEGTYHDQFRVVDGIVVFATSDGQGGTLWAGIDAATGATGWMSPGRETSELRVEGGLLFASPYSGGQDRLVQLDPSTGAELMPTGVEHSVRGAVAGPDGLLLGVATTTDAAAAIQADGTGALMRVDPATGAVAVVATFRDTVQQLVPDGDDIVVMAADDQLFCD